MITRKYYIIATLLLTLIAASWNLFEKKSVNNNRGLYEADINYISTNGSTADNFIYTIKEQLEKNGDNEKLYVKLGAAYIQKARETFDPMYYANAEDAIEEALDMNENNTDAISLLASVYLSKHDFKKALELGNKALTIDPYHTYTYSILVDAQNELGMYNDAIVSAQKMIDLKPNLTSYSRVSYVRELHGDVDGAIEAMLMAVDAGAPSAENTAWVKIQLGNLYYNNGEIDKAEHYYESSTDDVTNYTHGLGGLAKIALFKKDLDKAIRLYREALSKNALPEYLIALGDVYTITGQNDKAKEQYDKVKFALTMLKDNGIETDLELAIFNADHNRNIDESLEKVEEAFEDGSRSIKTYHAYAWLNYKKGDYKKAEENIISALALGTKDPLMYYHAGKIFEKAGQTEKANEYMTKALQINPYYQILYSGS